MRKRITLPPVLITLVVSCIIMVLPADASENSWMPRPPMLEPAGRAVAVDEKIYAIGETVQVYDPETLTWTQKASVPRQVGGDIAVYQNKIYIIGESYNEVYDIATDTWASKTAMPTWRRGMQANVAGGKIYLIGGEGSEPKTITYVNEAYDPATDSWATKKPIPTPIYHYASAVVDNKIYVIGGSAEPPNVVLDLVQIYDPENDSWTTGTSMPTPIRYASAAATTGLFAPKRIYVIGGYQNSYGLNITQVYDPQTDSWTAAASMPTARYDLGLAVVNDTIYALGGVLLPPYAFPKEPLTTNEVYLPLGYEGPLPPYWQPTASPSPSPSSLPLPTVNPTQQPTTTPALSSSPPISIESDAVSLNSVIRGIVTAAVVAAALTTVLIIRRRRKRT